MNKVVKIALISEQTDVSGNKVDYIDVCKILWELQYQTREIKNKTIQMLWEWNNFSSDYKKKFDFYPKPKEVSGKYKEFYGYIYNQLKNDYSLQSGNLSTTIKDAERQFKAGTVDFRKGTRSIIAYKGNQPLDLHNNSISLRFENNEYIFRLALLNKESAKEHNLKTQFTFKALVKDNSTRTILERCFDNIYHISASKLIYDQKKRMWYLNLVYSFDNTNDYKLDKEKILGVDLGIHYPICASVYGDLHRFIIDGGEIEQFRRKVEARKISMLKQGKNCGDGRIGHGVQTRNKPVYKMEDKIARFRDTVNHKYSRALIDYAVKNNCGVIQMEDLTGITKDSNRFLKNWSYFDLQTKIEYKAEEAGIKTIKIAPNSTSRRCSRCGYIDKENRPEQARFVCLKCGFTENADYNASQNIGIKDIDKIIEQELSKL